MQVSGFDLVVSGINRGDNLGLHVIYSGTVGAAREAACKVLGPDQLSLDKAVACICMQISNRTTTHAPHCADEQVKLYNCLLAVQGVPAVAVSLDNYKALTPDGFSDAAAYTTAFVKVRYIAVHAISGGSALGNAWHTHYDAVFILQLLFCAP